MLEQREQYITLCFVMKSSLKNEKEYSKVIATVVLKYHRFLFVFLSLYCMQVRNQQLELNMEQTGSK